MKVSDEWIAAELLYYGEATSEHAALRELAARRELYAAEQAWDLDSDLTNDARYEAALKAMEEFK